jgi:hypothetical protein
VKLQWTHADQITVRQTVGGATSALASGATVSSLGAFTVEGKKPGANMNQSVVMTASLVATPSVTDTIRLTVIQLDLDHDQSLNADNAVNDLDDGLESTVPAGLAVNDDDDDPDAHPGPDNADEIINGPRDRQDMLKLTLHLIKPNNVPLGSVTLSGGAGLRIFKARDGSVVKNPDDAESIDLWSEVSARNLELLAEGVTPGLYDLTATYRGTDNNMVATDVVKIAVVKIEIAMDGNRDGVIDFDDPEDRKCLFWVNDDRDQMHYEEFEWHEDDVKVRGKPDCNDDTIGQRTFGGNTCKRDLEDFTRLHIRVQGLPADWSGVTYHTKLEDMTAGSPAANLFEAVDEEALYLTNEARAELQLQKRRLVTVSANETPLESRYIKPGGETSWFILEGKAAGTGKLTLIMKQQNREIARNAVTLELHPMRWFYDIYRVDATPPRPRRAWEVTVDQTATRDQAAGYAPRLPNEILVLVHGWNVNDWERNTRAETAFKRLWWLGFQGRLVAYNWPTLTWSPFPGVLTNPHNFDDSEYRAWLSAPALASLLAGLNRPGMKLCVLAHSQGNVVAGEALRQYAGSVPVTTYVATQAALSTHAYDNAVNAPPAAFFLYPLTTPNIYGYYPGGPADPTNPPPYFAPVDPTKVGSKWNFYNRVDYALTWRAWELNNAMKPDDWAPHFFNYDGRENRYEEGVDQFYRWLGDSRRDVLSVTDARLPERYRIFAYGAESRVKALGTQAPAGFQGFDLETSLGYDGKHYSHSRQFRSNVVAERPYWLRLMFDSCKFTDHPTP